MFLFERGGMVSFSRRDQILLEQARRLATVSVIPIMGSAFGCVLLALVHWSVGRRDQVMSWVLLVGLALAIRVPQTMHFRRKITTGEFDPRKTLRYALGTALSGAAWGYGGLLLVTGTTPLGQVMTITALQGMVMGGVVTLSLVLPAFLAFTLPAMLPMVIRLALAGDWTSEILAAYSLIFTLLMIGIARSFNLSQRRTIVLTLEHEDLIVALRAAHDEVLALSQTDTVTSIANRRYFDEALAQELARAKRSQTPIGLLMVDIDSFKQFNDNYGHTAGDDCLRRVAQAIRDTVHRPPDLAARYGGEEFVCLLPDTESAGVGRVGEVILTAVRNLAIPHAFSGVQPVLTVSVGGVSILPMENTTPTEIIEAADRQLYLSKTAGRNRLSLPPSPDPEPALGTLSARPDRTNREDSPLRFP